MNFHERKLAQKIKMTFIIKKATETRTRIKKDTQNLYRKGGEAAVGNVVFNWKLAGGL